VRLLICDADETDVHSALGNVDAPGASVLVNPQWITPDPSETLWIACGAPALKMVQAGGWIPKKGGVVSNRGKLFQGIQPDGWTTPINLGVTFAPQIMHIEYSDFVNFQTDIALYRRFEATGTMEPKLGHYTYAHDLSGVVEYCKKKYMATGQPVELALDTETEGLDPHNPLKRIVCLQASAKEGIADVVHVLDDHVWSDKEQAYLLTHRLEVIIGQLQWLVSQPWIKIVGANFKYDMGWLRAKWGIVVKNFTFDTCNGGSLVEENRCVDPNTQVLMADLSWKRAGDCKVGDAMVGFDEHPPKSADGFPHRRMRKATVIHSEVLQKPQVRITLRDGTSLIVSDNHQFLCRKYPSTHVKVWRKARNIKPGCVIFKATPPPSLINGKASDFERGRLSGFLDGEGHACKLNHHGSWGVGWWHKAGDTHDDMLRIAEKIGIDLRQHEDRKNGEFDGWSVSMRGAYGSLHALVSTRPVRLVEKEIWDNGPLPRPKDHAVVASVEPLGIGPVVALETSTHTFIAEGLLSHNSNTLNLHTKVYSPELGGYDDPLNTKYDKSKMGEIPKSDLLAYAGGDTDACLRNYHKIKKQLIADNQTSSGKPARNSLTSVYMNVVHPTLYALHKMEHTGVYVDHDKFHAFGADLENRMHESMKFAVKALPKSIIDKHGGLTPEGGAPLSKPHMIAEFLFSPTGLNLIPTQVTEKTKKPSTAEYHLAQFKDHPEAGPLIERYLDYKSVSKMYGTYYEGFKNHLRHDGRWHPSYIIHKQGDDKNNEQAAAGTVTGRGSAVAPAFQCVTGDTEVMTPKGIKRAAELIDPHIPEKGLIARHETVVAGQGGFRNTSHVFRSWRQDILKVVFDNGNELKCTPEHPFMLTTGEWVKAKDLHSGCYAITPEKIKRAPMPDWCTPRFAEALGIIMGVGQVAMTAPTVYIDVPVEFAPEIQDMMQADLGLKVSREYQEDRVALSFDMVEGIGHKAAMFFLCLPDPGDDAIPQDLRGTEAMLPYIRGMIRSTGKFGSSVKRYERLEVSTTRRDVAMAILRETTLEGVQPPVLRALTDRWTLCWRGHSAAYIAAVTGVNPEKWDPTLKRDRRDIKYAGMRVKEILPSEANYVYDFTVPSTHSFYANGLLVHNTVPKHSYWGKRLRECIIAPPGYKIVARDYSQGELKVAACWAGETKMIQAYQNGIDLHTLTAATVNGMSYEEAMFLKKQDADAYGELRQNGKAGNFGLLYGMSAYGFMMYADAVYGVKLTIEQAEAMRDAFFDLYPILPLWHDKQIMEANINGFVRSPLGRVRHLPTINSPIKAVKKTTQNQAINSPIQGTLVDMMWMSMGIIERDRPELLIPFAQVHDQGLWYVPEDKEVEALAYSGEIMENLPFEEKFGWKPELVFNTDAEVGYDLDNLEKVAA